jgi:hypothetical protein
MSGTIADRIRKYILGASRRGDLKAGEKLPSYAELCRKFSTSYASVQYAFKEFEKDGLVERVQGVGTFLKGTEPLSIDLYIDTRAFPPSKIEPLLMERCGRHDLHLNIKAKSALEAHKINGPSGAKKAVIVQDSARPHFHLGSLLDISSFSDYRAEMSRLSPLWPDGSNVSMPFFAFSTQMAWNPRLLRERGVSVRPSGASFDWWDDYARLCRERGIHPAVKQWDVKSLWIFPRNLSLITIGQLRGTLDNLISLPFFDCGAGRRLLRIIGDHSNIEPGGGAPRFVTGDAGVDLGIGSWITVQRKRDFSMPEDSLLIEAYRIGGRKLCVLSPQYLRTFIANDIRPDEKQRVWELLKIMVSKDFQSDLCAMSGALSVRSDMRPEDYLWNTREDFAEFIPGGGDLIINEDPFGEIVTAALGALYEQHEFHGAEAGHILRSMDKKIESLLSPT